MHKQQSIAVDPRIEKEVDVYLPKNHKSPFLLPMSAGRHWRTLHQSSAQEDENSLTTDLTSLTTRSADLQSAFGCVVRTWYMSTALRLHCCIFSEISPSFYEIS